MEIQLNTKEREKLLGELCVVLGFCLPQEGYDALHDDPPATLSDFVDAVFRHEGLDPETADLRLKRQVRDMIADANRHSSNAHHPAR